MFLSIRQPIWLLPLLVLLPLIYLIGWRSLVYLRPLRRSMVYVVRSIVVVLLVLAVAGVNLVRTTDALSVVFLVDQSDSVGADNIAKEHDWITSALQTMGTNDRAAVVAFGKNTVIERLTGPGKDAPNWNGVPSASATDIAGALRLGMGLLTNDSTKRVILLSDGAETNGQALTEAQIAASTGVHVDTVTLKAEQHNEVLLGDLVTPNALRQGENFDLRVNVQSTITGTAHIKIYADNTLVADQPVTLVPGSNNFTLPQKAGERGFRNYRAVVEPATPGMDTYTQNNEMSAYAVILGKPKVLVVDDTKSRTDTTAVSDGSETDALVNALKSGDIEITQTGAQNLPTDVSGYHDVDTVILVNVAANSLGDDRMRALQQFVQNQGGGLVAIGGDNSFGLGGYFRTPLEETLPVEMELKGKKETPSIGLILVIDKSGSMGELFNGVSKMQLAKEAAIRTVDILTAQDQIGVIAFDETPRWIVQPQYVKDKKAIQDAISGIRPSGGTRIFEPLQAAVDSSLGLNTKVKHIILMTDGMAAQSDYTQLLQKMVGGKITLTTVAVGNDADVNLLKSLAEKGKGRFYYTDNPNTVPTILTKETVLISRSYLIEETFKPALVNMSPILTTIDPKALPNLRGYVAATPKATAEVILQSNQIDPILVQWQYGLGRSVAWLSDAKARWSADWLSWSDFAKFWSQTVQWTLPKVQDRNLQSRVEVANGHGTITVDAVDSNGQYRNFAPTKATVTSPTGEKQEVTLDQVAPGQYQGGFTAGQEGAYSVDLQQSDKSDASKVLSQQMTGVVVPYSAEYRSVGPEAQSLMQQLATKTNGRAGIKPEDAFAHNLPLNTSAQDISLWLLVAAVVLFLFDVGLRRIFVTWRDLQLGLSSLLKRG